MDKKLQAVKDAQRLYTLLHVMNKTEDFQEHLARAEEVEKYIDKSYENYSARDKLQAVKDVRRLYAMLKAREQTAQVIECVDLVLALGDYINEEI